MDGDMAITAVNHSLVELELTDAGIVVAMV